MSLDASTREPGRVGQYRLVQRLGEGGMGVVHLALDPAGKAVAIKVLRAHVAGDPDARQRLVREVATLRRVRHPRVAAVIDADVECEVPYVVTNFVPGKTLEAHVRDHGPLPRGHVARIGAVLADALKAIHDLGIVHRDVKPANVMLLDGEPILIDFGIAHVTDESRITHTGLVMGTPGYLSPEIIGGDPVTAATDWWGWGATLAYAATGRPPFGTGPIEVVLDRVRRGAADVSGVDAGLRATLTAALSVDPRRRPRPDRLVAGLAATAPVRNPVRTGPPIPINPAVAAVMAGDAPTERTPPPSEARTVRVPPPADQSFDRAPVRAGSPAEALTEVVPPPAGWGAPQLPSTRRFDPPGSPPDGRAAPDGYGQVQPAAYGNPHGNGNGNGRSGPANGFGAAGYPVQAPPQAPRPAQPGPAPWGRPDPVPPAGPASSRPQSPPAFVGPDAGPDEAAGPSDLTRGVLLGVLVALAAIAGVAPYGAVWIAAVGMLAARVVDRSSTALLLRRDQRGPRGSDRLVTTAALPWRLVTSAVATGAGLILPCLIGVSVAFITASAVAGAPARALPGQPGPLAIGMVALVLTAWWGPGGGSVRRGAVKAAQFVVPSPKARIVFWFVLGLVLLSALSVMSKADSPDWGPLNGSTIVDQLSVN